MIRLNEEPLAISSYFHVFLNLLDVVISAYSVVHKHGGTHETSFHTSSSSATNHGYTGSSATLTPHPVGTDPNESDHTYDEVDTRPHHHGSGSAHHVSAASGSSSWHHVIPSRVHHVNKSYVGSRDELRVYKDEGDDFDVDDLSSPGDGDVGDTNDFDDSHLSQALHPKIRHFHAIVHKTDHNGTTHPTYI